MSQTHDISEIEDVEEYYPLPSVGSTLDGVPEIGAEAGAGAGTGTGGGGAGGGGSGEVDPSPSSLAVPSSSLKSVNFYLTASQEQGSSQEQEGSFDGF